MAGKSGVCSCTTIFFCLSRPTVRTRSCLVEERNGIGSGSLDQDRWLGEAKLQKILETMAARVAGDCARGALSSTPASTCPRRSRRAGAAERGKRLLVSRRDILSGTSVAMGLKVSRPSSSARAATGAAPGEATVAYEDAMVSIGSQQIPVAVWAPSAGVGGSPPDGAAECDSSGGASQGVPASRGGTTSKGVAGYQHSISIAKIASVLFRLGRRLPTLFDQSMALDPAPWVFRGELTAPEGGYTKAIVLCHGYLGESPVPLPLLALI